jgi:hypothetical protein
LELQRVLVGPGQQQQVVDQPLDAEVLGRDRLGEGADRGVLGMRLCDLGVLADRRHR